METKTLADLDVFSVDMRLGRFAHVNDLSKERFVLTPPEGMTEQPLKKTGLKIYTVETPEGTRRTEHYMSEDGYNGGRITERHYLNDIPVGIHTEFKYNRSNRNGLYEQDFSALPGYCIETFIDLNGRDGRCSISVYKNDPRIEDRCEALLSTNVIEAVVHMDGSVAYYPVYSTEYKMIVFDDGQSEEMEYTTFVGNVLSMQSIGLAKEEAYLGMEKLKVRYLKRPVMDLDQKMNIEQFYSFKGTPWKESNVSAIGHIEEYDIKTGAMIKWTQGQYIHGECIIDRPDRMACHGEAFQFSPQGKLIAYKKYQNNRPTGLHLWFDADTGKTKRIDNYEVGIDTVMTMFLDDSGNKIEEVKKIGEEYVYFERFEKDKDDDTTLHKVMKKEAPDDKLFKGIYVTYRQDGKKLYEIHGKSYDMIVDHLIPDGPWRSFHPNGQMKSETFYKEGQPESLERSWYKNGVLRSTGAWRYKGWPNSEKMDTWEAFHPNGKIKKRERFENGKCVSLTEWHKNGQMKSDGLFNKDKPVGTHKTYFSDGAMKEVCHYDEVGNPIGNHVSYYQNGVKKSVKTYMDGKKHGVWEERNEAGEVTRVRHFIDDHQLKKGDMAIMLDFFRQNNMTLVPSAKPGATGEKLTP